MKKRLQDIIWKVEKLGASDLLTEIIVELSEFIGSEQIIQDLKIDNYQKGNLIKKYHNTSFPNLRNTISQLEELSTSLQDKLDKIREVVYGGFQREEIEDKIKSILEEE